MLHNRWLFRFVASAFIGSLVAVTAALYESGRPLGKLYDLALATRPSSTFPPSLLIVEASPDSSSPEGADVSEALVAGLLAMNEMDSSCAVIQLPVMTTVSMKHESVDEEIGKRFEEEFSLIEGNISTLFDAIKLGSIRPKDADSYVKNLIALVDEGKMRLRTSVESADADEVVRFERAANAFGHVWLSSDFSGDRAQLPGIAGIGPAQFHRDPDGVLREVRFDGLENRPIALTAWGAIHSDEFLKFDKKSFLLNPPRDTNVDLRRISLDLFVRYDELDKKLYHALKSMQRAGYFDSIDPTRYPTSIWEFAESTKAELLSAEMSYRDKNDLREKWRSTRNQFIQDTQTLLEGRVAASIVSGYDDILTSPELDENTKQRLTDLRSAVLADFAQTHEFFAQFTELRGHLQTALRGSFCIVGYSAKGKGVSKGERQLTDVEASANLIATTEAPRLSDRASFSMTAITAGIVACLTSIIISIFDEALSLGLGLFTSALSSATSIAFFFLNGTWIDPYVVGSSCAAATVASIAMGLTIKSWEKPSPRLFFQHRLSITNFSYLMKHYDDAIQKGQSAFTATLAVRVVGISRFSTGEDPTAKISIMRAFLRDVTNAVTNVGGVPLGIDGDLFFAAFGSPIALPAEKNPRVIAKQAVNAVRLLLEKEDSETLNFGLDIGECVFGDVSLEGALTYMSFGSPVIRARLLSGLATRYGHRVLVTDAFRSALGESNEALSLDRLIEQDTGNETAFYALNMRMKSSQ